MIEKNIERHIDLLIERYPSLITVKKNIIQAYLLLEECYSNDNKLLVAGNGGSAADSEHIMGELMKSFNISRPISNQLAHKLKEIDSVYGDKLANNLERSLMTIALVTNDALTTAYINDVDAESVFAQKVFGLGRKGDVFLGISTSGNSQNILLAAIVAKALGIKVIGFTGKNGGKLAEISDIVINVPELETYMIQELHLPVYHCLCLMLEERFFGTGYVE